MAAWGVAWGLAGASVVTARAAPAATPAAQSHREPFGGAGWLAPGHDRFHTRRAGHGPRTRSRAQRSAHRVAQSWMFIEASVVIRGVSSRPAPDDARQMHWPVRPRFPAAWRSRRCPGQGRSAARSFELAGLRRNAVSNDVSNPSPGPDRNQQVNQPARPRCPSADERPGTAAAPGQRRYLRAPAGRAGFPGLPAIPRGCRPTRGSTTDSLHVGPKKSPPAPPYPRTHTQTMHTRE